MAQPGLADEHLAALATAIGLQAPQNNDEWTARARDRLGEWKFEQLQMERSALARAPEIEKQFYDYVTADDALLSTMLEGRLGYYSAVLPQVATQISALAHGSIVDLGSYAGMGTLYLARRFPEAKVIGVERTPKALAFARRWAELAKVTNVSWIEGDYLRPPAGSQHDVVLSLQTVPTYMLPFIGSDSPESYARGKQLQSVDLATTAPGGVIRDILVSVGKWASKDGAIVLHERIGNVAGALLLQYLIYRAGMQVAQLGLLSWQTANEREGVQVSPLFLAKRASGAPTFSEERMLALLAPPVNPADLLRPEFDQGAMFRGPEAHARFQGLLPSCADLKIEILTRERQRFHIHLGVVAGTHAYIYTCATTDFRELKLCRKEYIRQMFSPVVDHISRQAAAGEVVRVHPTPESLVGILHARFGY